MLCTPRKMDFNHIFLRDKLVPLENPRKSHLKLGVEDILWGLIGLRVRVIGLRLGEVIGNYKQNLPFRTFSNLPSKQVVAKPMSMVRNQQSGLWPVLLDLADLFAALELDAEPLGIDPSVIHRAPDVCYRVPCRCHANTEKEGKAKIETSLQYAHLLSIRSPNRPFERFFLSLRSLSVLISREKVWCQKAYSALSSQD